MKTKLLALAACILTLASCAQNPPRAQIVPQPPRTPSLVPQADKAGKQIDEAKKTSADLVNGLDKATAEAKRLLDQKKASEAELRKMWETLTQEQSRTRALWQQLEDSSNTIEQLKTAAVLKDLEMTTVRGSLDTANKELEAAKKWQDMAAPKVAIYDKVDSFLTKMKWVIIVILIIGGSLAFVIYVLPLVLKVVKPL